jgi:hypothetical protein
MFVFFRGKLASHLSRVGVEKGIQYKKGEGYCTLSFTRFSRHFSKSGVFVPEVPGMILSIALGYVTGRLVRRRYLAPLLVLTLGVVIGLTSALLRIPLMYPLMVVQGTGVVIPEFRQLVLCLIVPEVYLYSELVPMRFPYSMTLAVIMTGLSVVGSFVGWWPVRHSRNPATPWE